MNINFEELAEQLSKSQHEIFWQGGADDIQLYRLEKLLKLDLPQTFKLFLSTLGGGGVADSEISGIESNDATLSYGGTVYGDTLAARTDYNLPSHLIVIFFKDDDTCWCIDTKSLTGTIVSYNVFQQKIDCQLAESFEEFFKDYVYRRLQ
ncbi:SMI1/KNR4 family protein [Enterovibrio makurazakiensis]|uniref:SMI1/KNR4 family protein n=1 Tax=Enterovibrio makurazakiensis TaxID=2910232 RepID=UPI003D239B82